jgi:MSHA biogenesis protein MshJ
MSALWPRYQLWFKARQPREKAILALAAVVAPAFLGFSLLVEPALMRGKQAQRTHDEIQTQLATMRHVEAELALNARDPDSALRAELAAVQAQRQAQDATFQVVERRMIAPRAMAQLLRDLLGQARGVELLELRSLPPESLLAEGNEGGAKSGAAAEKLANKVSSLQGGQSLYRHGIELKLAGSYPDLLAYLSLLESSAPGIGWGALDLLVERHPRSVLTLKLHTISLDSAWLVL